jgi:hypothetical protein
MVQPRGALHRHWAEARSLIAGANQENEQRRRFSPDRPFRHAVCKEAGASSSDDQKELIMAKWRLPTSGKAAERPAGHAMPAPVEPTGSGASGRDGRSPRQVRYDNRMENPQGWHSSFLSY